MKKLKKKKIIYYKNKRILMYSILGLFLFLGMGYSVLNTNLNILGNITVKEYVEPTLYNVLRKEAETNGLAKEYTGEHQDSMDPTKSTEKIYHWYATNNDEGIEVQNKNNVIFGNQCWQMIRTTDTGGVKMIYNGESENNQCLNTRGNHVGYAFSFVRNLASNYWYGTDYTYDSINQVFSISGTTEQAIWSDATSNSLIGKYTCMSATEAGTCSTLYLVESYYATTSAYVIQLDSNSNYSQFGILPFNASSKSLAYAGYMYGDVYEKNTRYSTSREDLTRIQTILSSKSLGISYWYADDIVYNSSTNKYSLVNPYQVNSTSDYPDLVGKYTFRNSTQNYTNTDVYYIAGVNGTSMYYKQLQSGNLLSVYETIFFGDSITDNGDGTYTINNLTNVTLSDWYSDYANYNNKYTCGDSSATCANPRYTIETTMSNYTYIDAGEKIMIGKTRTGLTLTDTLLVRKDELIINSSNYSGYKYTCNTDSATCTEATLRMILEYNTIGYIYVPNHYYGSSVTWDGTNYTLVDPIEMENYHNLDNLATHHYMCLTAGSKTCSEVAYIYSLDPPIIYYIIVKDGITTIDKVLEDMLAKNTNDSVIKKGIDIWYKKYLLSYSNDIEDTVFCFNRTISSYVGWKENRKPEYKSLSFKMSFNCQNDTDMFSVSNPKAQLTYPVGLTTLSELALLNNSNSRKTGNNYWVVTPEYFRVLENLSFRYVNSNGELHNDSSTNSAFGVRPVISLKPGTEYVDGNGSMEEPYFIGDAYSITNDNSMFKIKNKSVPGYSVSIKSKKYIVTSFKLNGNLVEGDTFTMPSEDVEITDIQYVPAYYTITNNDTDIEVPAKGRYGDSITLDGGERYFVTSFKMNGTLIEGNTFTMPLEDVVITDIVKVARVVVESEHNPYPNSQNNVVYYENTFEGATSLIVELTYQTESTSYDWIYLYDNENSTTPVNNKKYGGSTLTRETITINSNYLKILFRTDGNGNDYYGFKAVITPNYD